MSTTRLSFLMPVAVGSLLGGQIADRAHPRHLDRAFAVLLIAVALYTAARGIPALF